MPDTALIDETRNRAGGWLSSQTKSYIAISDIMLIVSLEYSRARKSIPVSGRRIQALSVSAIPRELNPFG